MSNFVRKIWEARLINHYSEASVLSAITTAPTSMSANAIVFNKVNVGSIKDYDGKVDWEAIDTEPVEMLFECKKYFAGSVDDIDKAQTNIDVIDAFASANMGEVITAQDRYAYGKYADGAASKLGEKAITSTYGIYDLIVDLGVALGEKNVPVTNRAVAIGWEALGLLEKDARFTHNPEVLANGIVKGQKINGMTVVVSNSAPAKTLVAMHKSAVGFGQQIAELEGMRLQGAFADGVRGLVVGGACVLNADGVATATYTV